MIKIIAGILALLTVVGIIAYTRSSSQVHAELLNKAQKLPDKVKAKIG